VVVGISYYGDSIRCELDSWIATRRIRLHQLFPIRPPCTVMSSLLSRCIVQGCSRADTTANPTANPYISRKISSLEVRRSKYSPLLFGLIVDASRLYRLIGSQRACLRIIVSSADGLKAVYQFIWPTTGPATYDTTILSTCSLFNRRTLYKTYWYHREFPVQTTWFLTLHLQWITYSLSYLLTFSCCQWYN